MHFSKNGLHRSALAGLISESGVPLEVGEPSRPRMCCADIEIQANEILHHKLTLNGYLSEFTGQPMERITQDTDRSVSSIGFL